MRDMAPSPLRQACVVALFGLALMSFTLLIAHMSVDDWEYELLRAHLAGVPLEQLRDDYLARRAIPWTLAALGLLAGAAAGFRAVRNTEHAALERRSAYQDPLTHLPNRRAFDQRLRAIDARERRTSRPTSLLFIDLDGFKQFNDRYGHALGDRVLVSVAVTLRDCLDRAADACCRWGGDEFVVLLPGTADDGARQVAERIVGALRSLRVYAAPGCVLRVSGSVGIATLEECPGRSAESLPLIADRALAEAKRVGKGVVVQRATRNVMHA